MTENEVSDVEKEEVNPLKYAKKYINPNGEMEPLDFNPLSEEFQMRLEDRVSRFGVLTTDKTLNKENLLKLFDSLAIKPPDEFFQTNDFESGDKFDEKNEVGTGEEKSHNGRNPGAESCDIRYEAIHVRGVDNMSTNDVFVYFDDFPPKFIEWVNDSSCNVVYSDVLNACKALLAKSKPYEQDDLETKVKDDPVEKINENEQPDENAFEAPMDTDEGTHGKTAEKSIVKWRLGDSYTKASSLLMRFATKKDQKVGGKPQESIFYQKYGNPNLKLWTKNLKHKKSKNDVSDEGLHRRSSEEEGEDTKCTSDDDFENKKDGNVKERLGNRQGIQVKINRTRSLSDSRPREKEKKSVKKSKSKASSKLQVEKDALSSDEMTSFDRHVKDELEARKKRRQRGSRNLWTGRKRHHEHDDDRDVDDYDDHWGGRDYAGHKSRNRGDDYDRHRGVYDNDGYKRRRGGDYDGGDYEDRKVTRGDVKSRLGEVRRSQWRDENRRSGGGNEERRRNEYGHDDDVEEKEEDDVAVRRKSYKRYDEDYSVSSRDNTTSVFNRLGKRN